MLFSNHCDKNPAFFSVLENKEEKGKTMTDDPPEARINTPHHGVTE